MWNRQLSIYEYINGLSGFTRNFLQIFTWCARRVRDVHLMLCSTVDAATDHDDYDVVHLTQLHPYRMLSSTRSCVIINCICPSSGADAVVVPYCVMCILLWARASQMHACSRAKRVFIKLAVHSSYIHPREDICAGSPEFYVKRLTLVTRLASSRAFQIDYPFISRQATHKMGAHYNDEIIENGERCWLNDAPNAEQQH